MTVSDGSPPTKAASDGGEPLVQSVRDYLANEPHKLVVRVLPQPEPEPQLSDVQIIPDTTYAISDNAIEKNVLKRNDLNNNSKNKFSSQKNQTEENQSNETNRPVDANGMPSAAERMQRQPLLARCVKQESHIVLPIDDSEHDQEDGPHPSSQIPNGDFQISESALGREEPYPKEIGKSILAFVFLCCCVCINMLSLSLVHERVPDRNPLPDVFLDNVPPLDWGLSISEYILSTSTTIASIVILLHKHRFIVARRIFFIMGLLYFYRSFTMFVTVLPTSSTTYYCSPKANHTTPILIIRRMAHLISGFGLSINGKHTFCGDYIYSGHTTILILSYYVISEYSPRKWRPLHWSAAVAALTGIILLLLAHGHYTVDVLIAYYITTRLFWTYHTLTGRQSRQSLGMITKEWWYPIFLYFEKNVHGPLPRQYNWPLVWPKTKLFSRLS
ncbi:phosphatidylcholine:ceramide cholinephosphotransferase 2-like isoform X2 [Arctopsyche grandis]